MRAAPSRKNAKRRPGGGNVHEGDFPRQEVSETEFNPPPHNGQVRAATRLTNRFGLSNSTALLVAELAGIGGAHG